MTDHLSPQPASDVAGFLPGALGLRLDEEFMPLVSLSATPEILDQILPFGQMQGRDTALLLRVWPDVIYASGAAPDAPVHITDISHGMTHFRLRGVEALHFLAHYTRADMFDAKLRQTHALRTRINHYDCTIWWTNTRDIHLLVDRSVAQSFATHLQSLSQLHDPSDPSTLPYPVAPDAPHRRG